MKLVVISPEQEEPREAAVLGDLFAAGLERYHVRKPNWSHEMLETWLRALPVEWRSRLVLHQHHDLVDAMGLAGRHWRDEPASESVPNRRLSGTTSRSCHDLETVRGSLGRFDSIFFGPVFASVSKPGHGPRVDLFREELSALLAHRSADQRGTAVLALGGITITTLPEALMLGFDGVGVLGSIWQAPNPVRAFCELRDAVRSAADARNRTTPVTSAPEAIPVAAVTPAGAPLPHA